MARIVTFGPNGARIHEGADPKDFKGQKGFLIDPIYPRGVAPHEWKLHPDGHIEGTSPIPPAKKRSFNPVDLAAFLSGFALAFLLFRYLIK